MGSEEQHRVSDTGPRLAFISPRDARTKEVEASNNAEDWKPSDLLRAVAARIDRGDLVATKAVLVLTDDAMEDCMIFSAGTKSVLETSGLLVVAATA